MFLGVDFYLSIYLSIGQNTIARHHSSFTPILAKHAPRNGESEGVWRPAARLSRLGRRTKRRGQLLA